MEYMGGMKSFSGEAIDWIDWLGEELRAISLRPSECLPGSTVVLTQANGYHWQVMRLGLEPVASMACFSRRLAIAALDAEAYEKCRSDGMMGGHASCFQFPESVRASDWVSGDWFEAVFFRLRAQQAALKRGVAIYQLDADVFVRELPSLPEPYDAGYDLRHQYEVLDLVSYLARNPAGCAAGRRQECEPASNATDLGRGMNLGQMHILPTRKAILLLNLTIEEGRACASPSNQRRLLFQCGTQESMKRVLSKNQRKFSSLARLYFPPQVGSYYWGKLHLLTSSGIHFFWSLHLQSVTTGDAKLRQMRRLANRARAANLTY